LLIAVAVIAPAAARGDELRTWTDATGRKVEAKFVRVEDGEVTLDKAGQTLKVPLERFSSADQQYIREKTNSGNAAKTSGPNDAKKEAGNKEPKSKATEAAAELRRAREWKLAAGGPFKARFERFFGQKVILVQGNKVRPVDFSLLSSADRDFLRQNFEAQGKGDLVPKYVPPTTGPNSSGPGAAVPGQVAGIPGAGDLNRPQFRPPSIPQMQGLDRAQEMMNRMAQQSQNQNEHMRSRMDEMRNRIDQMRAQAAANREQIAKSIPSPPAVAPSAVSSSAVTPPSTSPAPSGYGQPSAGYGQPTGGYGQPSGYGQPNSSVASTSPAASSSGPLYTPPSFSSPVGASSSNSGPSRDQVYTPPGMDSSSQTPFSRPFAGSPMAEQEVIICGRCNKPQKLGFKAGQKCQHCGVTIDEITDEGGKVVERSVRSRGREIKFWVWAAIAIISIIGGAIAKLKG
jgi:hypothetical protein